MELVLLPGLAAVLPWPWCYALFKRIARWQWIYREPCELALIQARARSWAGADERHWLWVRKVVTLVDHADHYLGLFRSDQWMKRYLHVQGSWPAHDRSLLLATFHWGAGYWGLRHASAHGLKPHALVASLDTQAYRGRTIMGWYARARNANVARTLASHTVDASRDLKTLLNVVKLGHALLGVLDVPADDAKSGLDIVVLGMKARVPRGLLRLAVAHQIPVVVYVTGLDTETGHRYLHIQPVRAPTSLDNLARDVFAELEQLIARDAPAWHFWSVSERFFRTGE